MGTRTGKRDADGVERRIQFADAALALAGHEVTDPTLRELSRRVAAARMSADEAIAAGMKHLDAQCRRPPFRSPTLIGSPRPSQPW